MSRFVKFRQCLVAACLVAVVSVAAFGAVEVDPELPAYQPVEGVTGSTNRHLVYVGLEIVEMGPHGPVENKLFLVLFMLFMQ